MINPKDIVGKIFGELTVLKVSDEKYTRKDGTQRWQYECKCSCGNIIKVIRDNLLSGKKVRCPECSEKLLGKDKIKDLTGQRFGRLLILEMDKERHIKQGSGSKLITYKCLCDCGNITHVSRSNLTRKNNGIKSCGHCGLHIYKEIGEIVNNWEVVDKKELKENSNLFIYTYKCIFCGEKIELENKIPRKKCECIKEKLKYEKREKEKREREIKKIKIKECKIIKTPENIKDLTGSRFNNLVVLGFCGEFINKKYWVCKCDCGTIKTIEEYNLKRGVTKSCGCLQKQRISEVVPLNLTGQKFGKLTVIKRLQNNKYNQTMWLCRCECGNQVKCNGASLKSGHVTSCGCVKSKGEEVINLFLNNNHIKYDTQISFEECKDKLPLRFDFQIFYPNTNKYFLCEYQGEQHYKPFDFSKKDNKTKEERARKALENFENQQRKDDIKRKYCKESNIKLIEIKYTDFKNIENILRKELGI